MASAVFVSYTFCRREEIAMKRMTALLALVLLTPVLSAAAPPDSSPRFVPAEAAKVPPHLQKILPAVVGIHSKIPLDRPSALTLGPLRWGSGVIFDPQGHILTVGYIINDAAEIQVSLRDGRTVPARIVGSDLQSGIGVIKLEGDGPWPAAPLGDSTKVSVGDPATTLGVDSDKDLVLTQGSIQEIKRFAGYWEYLIDRAFIVAPYNPSFGGSPLVNSRGEVIGITSLRLGEAPHVNLAIPIEYFTAVREELLAKGGVPSRPPRPWIGIYTAPAPQGLVVVGGSPAGPAAEAGFQRGDVIVRLNGQTVEGQEDFYLKLWQTTVGEEIAIVVLRENKFEVIRLKPVDRQRTVTPPGK
jgi:S1-C subfamily serine protease